MNDLPLNVIPQETIVLAAALLPDPASSIPWSCEADIVSPTGVACTLQFQLRPFDCPYATKWRWEAVACVRRYVAN